LGELFFYLEHLIVGQTVLGVQSFDPHDFDRHGPQLLGVRAGVRGRLIRWIENGFVRHQFLPADAVTLVASQQIVEELPVGVVMDHLVGGPVEILDAEQCGLVELLGDGELQRRRGGKHRTRAARALMPRLETELLEFGPQIHTGRKLGGFRRFFRGLVIRGGLRYQNRRHEKKR
jgi:hypothetical protein